VKVLKDKYELLKAAAELRNRLGEDDRSPVDVFRLAHTIDALTLVFYPMGERISGMCIKGASDILIAVNSSMSHGRQRFSMAHELYHCFFDNMATAICARNISEANDVEKEANIFASFFLVPPAALAAEIRKAMKKQSSLTLADIIKLEQHFQISHQAMLIRLIEEGEITQQEALTMRMNIISQALLLGYTDALYRPLPEEKAMMTYGRYIKKAEELLERGLISNGKHEELLLEAFRADLVYGLDEGGELID